MQHASPEPSPQRTKTRIPSFQTVEEEAAFWDTHDLADFEDELEEVTDVRFEPASSAAGIVVRLDRDALAALTRLAHARGVRPSSLARAWILERLRDRPA